VTAATLDSIRHKLAAGVLARRGGVLLVALLDRDELAPLVTEAAEAHSHAETYQTRDHDGEEHRGGAPDRWLESAVAGPELAAVYSSRSLAMLLRTLTGLEWTTSGANGTYSYYRRPGHYLGLHRDVDECDLAVIICIKEDCAGDPGQTGALCVYPQRSQEPLSAIRTTPEEGAVRIRIQPGEAAILLGGIIPHRVVPVGDAHERIVAPLCFSVDRTQSGA